MRVGECAPPRLPARSRASTPESDNQGSETLGAVTKLVLDRVAWVGVSGPLNGIRGEIERTSIGYVKMIPVAAPSHPLAHSGRNAPGAGREHIQLVLTDRSPLTKGRILQW